jgi:hypothetical protein
MVSAPQLMLPVRPVYDNTMAPTRIAAAPRPIRRSTCSQNTTHAMANVERPSRLSRSDAVDAGVTASPTINSKGPTTPPANTTAPSYGRSPRRIGASVTAPVARRRPVTIRRPCRNPDRAVPPGPSAANRPAAPWRSGYSCRRESPRRRRTARRASDALKRPQDERYDGFPLKLRARLAPPQPSFFNPFVEHRQHDQRQHRRRDQASDDHCGERALHFRSLAC